MFSFCKKKDKVIDWCWRRENTQLAEIGFDEEASNRILETFFVPANKDKGCWWKSLPSAIKELGDFSSKRIFGKHIDFIKNSYLHIQKGLHWHENVPFYDDEFEDPSKTNRTAKTCPAINRFLSKSYLIKFPVDMIISIDENGRTMYTSVRPDLIEANTHDPEQFRAEGDEGLFDNRVNVKFQLPIRFSTHGVPYIYAQPLYHADQPFEVVPGIIEGDYTQSMDLNVNTFFRIPPKGEVYTHKFSAGEVLAYIHFYEKMDTKYIKYDTRLWRDFYRGFSVHSKVK